MAKNTDNDTLEGTVELVDGEVGKNPVGRPKLELDEARIRELYIGQQLSLSATATELGCAALTLRRRMGDYGIPVRGRGRPVKGARKIVGEVSLDPDFTESKKAQKALDKLLAAEAAELAAAEAEANETAEA